MKRKIIIWILVIALLIILGILAYFFLITPMINGFIIAGYNQGVTSAVNYLIDKSTACQPIPVTMGNQTTNLIAIECLTQAQPQPQEQPQA